MIDPKEIAQLVVDGPKEPPKTPKPKFIEGTEIPYKYKDVYDEVREAYCDCGWMKEQMKERCKAAGVAQYEDDEEGGLLEFPKTGHEALVIRNAIWHKLCAETCGGRNREEEKERRNLDFRASRSVPPKIAKLIMEKAIVGYNDWEPELMDHITSGEVFIAREGSVCIYVRGRKRLPRIKLCCNEYKLYKKDRMSWRDKTVIKGHAGEIRIWWD